MNISHLPPELIRILFENLSSDRSSLHALTMTSKGLRGEATRLLYGSMTNASGTANYRFLCTIRRNPDELAPLVRVYHAPSTIHTQRGNMWGLLIRLLPSMVNLKEFAIHAIVGSPLKIFPPLKKLRPAPFQLEKFVWTVQFHHLPEYTWTRYHHLLPEYTKQAFEFLRTQHELKHLCWRTDKRNYRGENLPSFPVDACSRLECLESNVDNIASILSSRIITELYWRKTVPAGIHRVDVEEDIHPVLKLKEFASLRALSCDTHWGSFNVAKIFNERFSGYLSNLEVLEVCFLDRVEQDSGVILDWLPRFPFLKKLVFTTSKPFAEHSVAGKDLATVIDGFFAQCRHLRYVDILWDSADIYRRWFDGIPLPNLLSIAKDKLLKLE